MERDSVGQTFLSALVDVRRQECPRHSGAAPAMADSLGGLGVLAVYHLRAARPTFRLLYRELVPVRRAGCFGTGASPKLRVWRREGDSSLYQTTICENLRHLRLQIFAASRLRVSFPCAFDEVDKVTDKARDEVGDCPCPLSPSLRHSASFIISF